MQHGACARGRRSLPATAGRHCACLALHARSTIRENIDRKRLEKLAETNPDAVNLKPQKPAAVASSEDGPPVALLAGGAVLLLLAAALLAGQ